MHIMDTSEEDKQRDRQISDDEYKNVLNLQEIEDKKLQISLEQCYREPHTIRDRRLTYNVRFLKHKFNFNMLNTICISFRMHEHDITTAYGFVYCDYVNNEIRPINIVYGPALTSQDGEYRSRGLLWTGYQTFFAKFESIINMVDEMICKKLNDGQLMYTVTIHADANKTQIEQFVDESRLAIKLHILCWLYDYYAIEHNYQENHMNPIYKYLMHQKTDHQYYEKIMEKMSDEEYQTMQLIDMSSIHGIANQRTRYTPLKAGQKLFPLIVDEYENPGDIRFPTWAEIYITNLCSNLTLNYISPSFYFIGGWFLIHNSNVSLYDNEASHDKFKYSNVSSKITRKLDRAIETAHLIDSSVRDFVRLTRQINRARTFARAKLNLSDYSLCLTSEFVGRTLADSYRLYNSGSLEVSRHVFQDKRNAVKFVFELIYAFYCANTRLGVIHGDPHINNITLFKLFFNWDPNTHPKWSKGNAGEAYLCNGRAYFYPYTGEHTCLIDFSRAVLFDQEHIRANFSPHVVNEFNTIQYAYFSAIIGHHLKEVNVKELNHAFAMAPEAIYKVFTGIDPLVSCRSLLKVISVEDIFTSDIQKIIVSLLDNIIAFCETTILNNFRAIQRDPTTKIEWINLQIIEQFFDDYALSADELGQMNIITVYSDQALLKNNVNNYAQWGNHISYEGIRNEFMRDNKWDQMPNRKESYERIMRQIEEQDKYSAVIDEAKRDEIELEPWMFM